MSHSNMSAELPPISEGIAEELKIGRIQADPWDMDKSAAKLMGMFDDLAYVVTLLRKVQTENERMRQENSVLKAEIEEHKRNIKVMVSKNVWRP